MAFIEIKDLHKQYQKVTAVNHINLDVAKGEMLTLLGPSGCGKTTTLRCIAGLEKPEGGDIVIDGKPLLSKGFVEPSKRGIGMVFQNYAVWPHMKVYNNIVYGLKQQRLAKREIQQKAQKVLDLVGLGGLAGRYPGQLSGGQQQRVALARALVSNPKVLLLDEPLSNLDAKLREELRFEIKSLVRRMGITSVYVTHDQAEAMVISDRIAIMSAGNISQVGTPQEIYEKPNNRFVADFIGTMNFLPGKVVALAEDGTRATVETPVNPKLVCRMPENSRINIADQVYAAIRPEDVGMHAQPPEHKDNLAIGKIINKAYLGNFLYFFVVVAEHKIRVQTTHTLPVEEGQHVHLHFNPEKCMILPE